MISFFYIQCLNVEIRATGGESSEVQTIQIRCNNLNSLHKNNNIKTKNI